MHLITFRLHRSDRSPEVAYAVTNGDPYATIRDWQDECDQRASELGVRPPMVSIITHRRADEADLSTLKSAGVAVHRFAGWDEGQASPATPVDHRGGDRDDDSPVSPSDNEVSVNISTDVIQTIADNTFISMI